MRDEVIYKAIERFNNGEIEKVTDCCYELLVGSVYHPTNDEIRQCQKKMVTILRSFYGTDSTQLKEDVVRSLRARLTLKDLVGKMTEEEKTMSFIVMLPFIYELFPKTKGDIDLFELLLNEEIERQKYAVNILKDEELHKDIIDNLKRLRNKMISVEECSKNIEEYMWSACKKGLLCSPWVEFDEDGNEINLDDLPFH